MTTRVEQGPPSGDLLLIAADLEERRLLYAELLEAGYEVLPVPGLVRAVQALLLEAVAPPLILLDVQGDEHATPQEVETLLTLAPGAALILVVGAINSDSWEPLRPRVAALLHRPMTVGQIVDVVRRTLPVDKRSPQP